jgi:hypothetical protein
MSCYFKSTYTFTNSGSYTITAQLSYNGVVYSAAKAASVSGGDFTPVITAIDIPGQAFGIYSLTNIVSNQSYELSFITSNDIQLTAEIPGRPDLSNDILWEVRAVSNTNLVQTILTNSAIFSFIVGKPTHQSYTNIHGSYSRSVPLAYQIKANYFVSADLTNSYQILISQDEQSIIRQEYMNHKYFYSAFIIPDYNLFVYNTSTPHFSYSELNNTVYDWAYIRSCLTNGLEVVRNAMDAPLTLNSCYRNPERNEAVGGVISSRHQYGYAGDVRVDDWNGDGLNGYFIDASDVDLAWTNVAEDWAKLASTARTNASADYIEGYNENHTWSYVHMDWRYH